MEETAAIAQHRDLIRRLGSGLPLDLERLGIPQHRDARAAPGHLAFRFTYLDVPFTGRVDGRGATAILALAGRPGTLPFTAQDSRRRRRALAILAEASYETGLDWRVADHEILVSGTAPLARMATPNAIIAAAVALVWRGERHLRLLLDILGEVACLSAAAL